MAEALQGTSEQRRPPPPGLVNMRISASTGMAARPDDSDAMFETFIEGHLPPVAEGGIADSTRDGTSSPEPGSNEPLF
jgi:membrane carboxypeptidase/penicillin-binding protein